MMFCVLKLSFGKKPLIINIKPKKTNITPSVFLVLTIIDGVNFFFSCLASIIFTKSVIKYAKITIEKKTTNLPSSFSRLGPITTTMPNQKTNTPMFIKFNKNPLTSNCK